MAEKYEIFIHSDQRSSIANKTQPKEEQLGGAFSVKDVYSNVSQFATSGFSGYVNTGVAALSKVAPIVAVAVAVAKIGDKVISTGASHLESYTGNYQFSMQLNNFKAGIGVLMNPIQYALKQENISAQLRLFNDRQKEYRTLMGESYIGV